MAKLRSFFGCVFMPSKCRRKLADFKFDAGKMFQDVKSLGI